MKISKTHHRTKTGTIKRNPKKRVQSKPKPKVSKTYEIKYWEDEERREMGESDYYLDEFTSKEKAVDKAKRLFYSMNYASVEVEDENGEAVFVIANDEPKGKYL